MNQIHLIVGRHRSEHCSFRDAMSAIRARIILRRVLDLLDDETALMLQSIFR